MALGVRGSNPVWAEFDLSGKIFDDTFYMYVLQNVIPYFPATVYHDPALNSPWTNPIQFLGNGTLPVDVFFDPNVVYRLEFRQNDGISSPTQSDPLIYEINNYIAGSSGSTPPITDSILSTDNQITNPQFALTSFAPNYSFSGTNPAPIQIGSGWVLEVAGTGTVALTKVPLNNSNTNPSNAPYALRITLTGWTTDSVFLRQRFQQNGMLWANKTVSSAITTRVTGSPRPLNALLIDSNNATLANILSIPAVNSTFNQFTGHGTLSASTNPNTPPAAYVDYKLAIPNNIDIYVTSIQVIAQDTDDVTEPVFQQDTIDRQIDHTYHDAYPIVPVGGVIDFAGFDVQSHFLLCNGVAYSRLQYNLLYQAITKAETVSLTNTVNTFTVVSGTPYRIGMVIEGIGIQAATTITNIAGNTITMSLPAVSTVSSVVRFFPYGNGDGSTTFNVPNYIDNVTAGAGGTGIVAANLSGIGGKTGEATHTQTINEMPAHTHGGLFTNSGQIVSSGAATFIGFNNVAANTGSAGLGNAFNVTQLTVFVNKLIRYE